MVGIPTKPDVHDFLCVCKRWCELNLKVVVYVTAVRILISIFGTSPFVLFSSVVHLDFLMVSNRKRANSRNEMQIETRKFRKVVTGTFLRIGSVNESSGRKQRH